MKTPCPACASAPCCCYEREIKLAEKDGIMRRYSEQLRYQGVITDKKPPKRGYPLDPILRRRA
jgi:hypothetical protein